MHQRYYSPGLARFVSVDPVLGDTSSSQSWNRYSYALNNPVKYVDPDGEWAHIAIGAAIGGAVNAGAKAIKNHAEGKPLTEGLGKAALVGALGGGVAAATFGMGAVAITGGGGAAAVGTLTGATAIPTAVAGGGMTATGGLLVGAGSSALGGGTVGALNEVVVEGNTDLNEVTESAVEGAAQAAALGGLLGASGAGPLVEAVVAEVSAVYNAGKKYVYDELVKTPPDPKGN